jgi:hypothetical protein
MKKCVLSVFIFVALTSYSQDSIRIKQIDSLVKTINQSSFKTERDSIIQDYSQAGMFIKTYVTIVFEGIEMKKYINEVHSARIEKDSATSTITTNIFFFDKDNLIKVEEFAVFEGKEVHADWYYADGKSLYYAFKQDQEKSAQRAEFLLILSKQLLVQFQQAVKNQKP